jgi:hypothetical protein
MQQHPGARLSLVISVSSHPVTISNSSLKSCNPKNPHAP